MKELIIESTKNTPSIILNPQGIIRIAGRSMSENGLENESTAAKWIDEYILDPPDLTRVDFFLEYLSTSNIKFFIEILRKISSVSFRNRKYVVRWYYEEGDNDILEKGENISLAVNIPFTYVKISETTS